VQGGGDLVGERGLVESQGGGHDDALVGLYGEVFGESAWHGAKADGAALGADVFVAAHAVFANAAAVGPHQDAVPGCDGGDALAHGFDDARDFVAQDAALADDAVFVQKEVAAADAARCGFDEYAPG